MPPTRARKSREAAPAPTPRSKTKGKAKTREKARDGDITREAGSVPSDAEISSSFELFALPRSDMTEDEHAEAAEADPDEEEDFVRVLDVRRILSALGLPRQPVDFFEADQRLVSRSDFVELAKTMREMGGQSQVEDGSDTEVNNPQRREIDHAFALFTTPIPSTGRLAVQSEEARTRKITLADLRRVAREVREDVDDKVLEAMMEEANGEEGRQSIAKGVGRDEFEAVMRRAGVFG